MGKQNVVFKHNGTLFSLKRNEILIHAKIWMNAENIMLNEIRKANIV